MGECDWMGKSRESEMGCGPMGECDWSGRAEKVRGAVVQWGVTGWGRAEKARGGAAQWRNVTGQGELRK